MKYPIIISLTAQQEEAEAYLFYENASPGLGERFLQKVENALEKLPQTQLIILTSIQQIA